jgi:cytochrome P450
MTPDHAAFAMPEVDFAYDDLPDLHEKLDELRAQGPVVPVKYHGNRVWLILDHALVKTAFEDYVHFDAADGYKEHAEPSQGKTIQTMSGEEHRVSRALVTPPFLPAKVRSYVENIMEPIAHELLDRIEGKSEVEFISAFTRPYPFLIITRLLGIPVEDEARFLNWAVKMIDFPWDPEGAVRAKNEFDTFVQAIIDEKRRQPTGDFISMLVEAEFEGEKLDDERIRGFLGLLFPAGSDTAYKNGSSLFAHVLGDPELRAMARGSDKDREAIVAEGLRWEPPVALLPRKASADVLFGGVQIRKGDWTLFGITAANNDPKVYPDPRRFDPRRDNRELLTFGRSAHFCLGMHVARRELETALRVVFERFPNIRLKPGQTVRPVKAVMRGPLEMVVEPYGAAH